MSRIDDEFFDKKYPLNESLLKIIIEAIPANVFFKDTELKYRMSSHIHKEQIRGNSLTIVGKTDFEVQKDHASAKHAFENDQKILRTRKGSRYTKEIVSNGEKRYLEIIKEPVIANGELLGIIGLVNDITELKRLQEELRLLSITDQLTGAYNRTYYEQKKADLLRGGYESLSVIMCDLNGLKYINDHVGHDTGDKLLRKTAEIIRAAVGDAGELIRIGGDEFIVVCLNCTEEKCLQIVRDIRKGERECDVLGMPVENAYGYATVNGRDGLIKAMKIAEERMYLDKANIKSASQSVHR